MAHPEPVTRGQRADRAPLKRPHDASDIGCVTTIRTTCPQCGEVDMSPEAILLSIRERSGEGSYRFSCPHCLDTVEKPADRKVAALLLSAGVELAEDIAGGRQAELFDGEPASPALQQEEHSG